MPLLYAADPDEALAVLESIGWGEGSKAGALLNTVRETPGLSRRQKLDLLDRAALHAKAAIDPDDRVSQLSRVAIQLFELGKADDAKRIVESVVPVAEQLVPKDHGAALAAVAEAVSLFDLPAGVRRAQNLRAEDADDNHSTRALFRIAYRVAQRQPAEAERIAAEALEWAGKDRERYYRRSFNREPTEEELAFGVTFDENRLVPLCYRLASVDADRAERLAGGIHNPHLRAYAMGMVAKALATTDRPRARKIILQAYNVLTEGCRNPDPRWPQRRCFFCPPTVAGCLLGVVEQIDPTLVGECMWRAVSYRLHRSADEFVALLEPEENDAALAAFVARYDRRLAHALLPAVDLIVTPAGAREDIVPRAAALTLIDFDEALRGSQRGSSSQQDPPPEASALVGLVPIELPFRWNAFAIRECYLWVPNERYDYESSFSW